MTNRRAAYIFALTVLASRVGTFIFTPLLLDSIEPIQTVAVNISIDSNATDAISYVPSRPVWQTIDPLIQIVISMGVDSMLLGMALLLLMALSPGSITERERNYPKRLLVLVGFAQSISALLYQYSASGDRTAPYLQSFLTNFGIPIMFILRFIILKKRPTVRKTICAAIITLAGMAALIPTFFPQIEDPSAHRREGGASGAWGIIWPFIYLLCSVPHAVSNIVLEKSVQFTSIQPQKNTEYHHPHRVTESELLDEDEERTKPSPPGSLNLIYTLFFTFSSTFCGALALFWVDFIPGFGKQQNVHEFLPQLAFNFRCIFGASSVCGAVTIALAWGRMAMKTTSFIGTALLLRHGEGANFYSLLAALVSPICFTFWTLFEEHPFRWSPEGHLSTWLTIAAIAVMVPCLILYERGPREISINSQSENTARSTDEEQSRTLLLNE